MFFARNMIAIHANRLHGQCHNEVEYVPGKRRCFDS